MALVVKNTPANAGDSRGMGLIPGSGRFPGGRQPTPVSTPRKFRGQRSLAGYSPWGQKELDMTEHTRICHTASVSPVIVQTCTKYK